MSTDYKGYVGFLGATSEDIRKRLRGSNGIQLTEALFEETCGSAKSKDPEYVALYSLKEHPTTDTVSAYQVFINSVDESECALKLVGSLSHWRKLCSLKWFLLGRKDIGFEGLIQWRQDMLDRDRSAAKRVLMRLSSEGNVTAARSLDKMALDEAARQARLLPADVKSTGKSAQVIDGLEFLDELGR